MALQVKKVLVLKLAPPSDIWGKIHRQFCYSPSILCRLNLSPFWKGSHPNFYVEERRGRG